MRREGVIEILRRAATLLLLVVAVTRIFAVTRAASWLSGLPWIGLAVAVYLLVPRPAVPEGALHHERLPSTVMPDLIGFLLGTTFFAMPLVIINTEAWLEGVWWIPLMFWLPGLFALAIFYMAASYACSWILLRRDGMTIASLWAIVDLPFADIQKVNPIARRLPRWIGWALVLFGGLQGAGVALLHAGRVAHYLDFERKSGPPLRFAVDAFPDIRRVVAALRRARVPLDLELA